MNFCKTYFLFRNPIETSSIWVTSLTTRTVQTIMIEQTFNHFVFNLSTFPFTTYNALGRIFVFFVLMLKRHITSWKGLGNVETSEIFKQLCNHKRTPLDTAIRLNEFEIVKHFIDVLQGV